jgi:hypothetical protein
LFLYGQQHAFQIENSVNRTAVHLCIKTGPFEFEGDGLEEIGFAENQEGPACQALGGSP